MGCLLTVPRYADLNGKCSGHAGGCSVGHGSNHSPHDNRYLNLVTLGSRRELFLDGGSSRARDDGPDRCLGRLRCVLLARLTGCPQRHVADGASSETAHMTNRDGQVYAGLLARAEGPSALTKWLGVYRDVWEKMRGMRLTSS